MNTIHGINFMLKILNLLRECKYKYDNIVFTPTTEIYNMAII